MQEDGIEGLSRRIGTDWVSLEHARDVENKSESSPLWKHMELHHLVEDVEYTMKVTRSIKTMEIQENEGTTIRDAGNNIEIKV